MALPLGGRASHAEWGRVQSAGTSALRSPLASSAWSFLSGAGRSEVLERYWILGARLFISQIFLISGLMKLIDWAGTDAQMASRGMFWIPFFHVAAMLTELGAGLALLLGYKARLGALVLFLFLIPVTLTFHTFWTYPSDQQKTQMLFFMHNIALMGGLLFVMTLGPGPISVDLQGRRAT